MRSFWILQSHAIAKVKQRATFIAAPSLVMDAVAVADIELLLSAEPPYGVLDKARKRRRIFRTGLPGIDPCSDLRDDVGASVGLITGRPIGMLRVKSPKDAGPMQKVMNQRVDGDHAHASIESSAPDARKSAGFSDAVSERSKFHVFNRCAGRSRR